ncbi:hypothetical protein [Pseudomonas fluorescens]|uniref:Uncharacterized protein n=1 Tax=Pseudomonas fluorescens TaxID=294 RepID=A0A5E7A6S8_PSEFL|nr:hypothetical protein [Pseudomonas fluorescens]VVN74708.1 hypothetical protein PS710_00666 [Pseudomonas fluorescens]
MPVVKCFHGHEQHVSTDDWVAALTMDQLRYARDLMDEKIKAAEAQPKRVVWRVCCGGLCLANYQEDQYEKAADHLLRIFKESFMEEAPDYVKKPYGTETFRRTVPSIEIERVTQFEYDTEWFPEKP